MTSGDLFVHASKILLIQSFLYRSPSLLLMLKAEDACVNSSSSGSLLSVVINMSPSTSSAFLELSLPCDIKEFCRVFLIIGSPSMDFLLELSLPHDTNEFRRVNRSSGSSFFMPISQFAVAMTIVTMKSRRNIAIMKPSQKPTRPISSKKPKTNANGIPMM